MLISTKSFFAISFLGLYLNSGVSYTDYFLRTNLSGVREKLTGALSATGISCKTSSFYSSDIAFAKLPIEQLKTEDEFISF